MYTKYLSTFMVALSAAIIVALTYPFFVPVALAAVVAVLLGPIHNRLSVRFKKIPVKVVAGFCVFVFFVAFMTPLGLILAKAISEVGNFFSELNSEQMSQVRTQKAHQLFAYADKLVDSIGQTLGFQIQFEPLKWVKSALGKTGNLLVASMTAVLSGAPAALLSVFIFTLALYYFLAEGDALYQKVFSYLNLPSAKLERLSLSFKEACKSIVLTNVITGVLQSVLIVASAAFTGFDDLLLIGTITFICSFIPVIGAAPIGFILAAIQFAQGESSHGVILVVMSVFTGGIDNIIRPMLLSGASAMHPLLSFLSIVGGIALMGLPGLFLGPILLQISLVMIEIYR